MTSEVEKTSCSTQAGGISCPCGCGALTEGVGHPRSMARLRTAIIGGFLIVNSFILQWAFSGQIFAAELSAMAGAVVLILPIFITAFKDLAAGRVHMNELVALAILAALTGGDFRIAGIIAFFLLLTIIIESRTASGAQRSIEELIKLTPHTAALVSEDGELSVEVSELKIGDVIRVRPGDNFPVDGVIIDGESTVNQASITGESLPVDKSKGDDVFAGTQNMTGQVDIKIAKVGEETTLGKVKELILAAEKTQTPIVRIIDKYAGYYTPAILMIAGLTWWFTQEMNSVVALLIISCPCALVLASPTAIVATVAAASRLGILIKNVADIELAAQIKAFVFDKTGTLTEGALSVARLAPVDGVQPAELLQAAVSVESASNHPVAEALRKLAEEAGLTPEKLDKVKEAHGKGVTAVIGKRKLQVGREAWLKSSKVNFTALNKDDVVADEGMSVIFVAVDGKCVGWIGFKDTIRSNAKSAILQLEDLGVRRCAMVTGDRASVAALVAAQLGIDEYQADCLPDGKVAYVEEMKKTLPVAVVGDGVNDAPALASGDLGIAMGAIGSDIAINSASVALMNNDLRRVPMLIHLAKKSRTIVFQNVSIGFLFVFGGITLSVFGNLPPVLAAILHTTSTLIVIFNSARLVRTGEELTLEDPETTD
ncbi:MAG: cation-translocating P-type ATPase [Victivallales bacterium]|nr:cation-translocating P-type ATPase [Victivallales bacterium]